MSSGGTIAAVTMYLLMGQSYMAGEWIFQGFEAKTSAYILLIWAIALEVRGKARTSLRLGLVIFSAVFHVHIALIGIALFGAMHLAGQKGLSRNNPYVVRLIFAAASITAFATAFSTGSGRSSIFTASSGEARQIYTQFRHPHHLVPFGPTGFFTSSGFTLFVLIFLALIIVRPRLHNRAQILANALILLHLLLPILLLLAHLDNRFMLGPLYVFRYLAIAQLLATLVVASSLFPKHAMSALGARTNLFILTSVSILGVFVVSGNTFPSLGIDFLRTQLTSDDSDLIAAVQGLVDEKEAILFDFNSFPRDSGLNDMNIELLIGRGSFVNWKFVATTPHEIIEWKSRLDLMQQWSSLTCGKLHDAGIDFVVGYSFAQVPTGCIEVLQDASDAKIFLTAFPKR